MKSIKLNNDLLVLLDDSDYDVVNQYHWRAYHHGVCHRAARPNCHTRNGDWYSKNATMHRFILKCKKGEIVDHIDGNPLNNQRSNLRICSHAENMRNFPKRTFSKSKFKGLTFRNDKNKWRVRICLNRKRVHVGDYDDEMKAAIAYNVAAIKYHGEFARLNVI